MTILSNTQCRKLPEGIRIGLENRFLKNWEHQEAEFFNKYFFKHFSEKGIGAERNFKLAKHLLLVGNIY